MIIPAVTLRKKKILEADEMERYESGPLWVFDEDYKNGRELNFKRYDDLSGLYELYLDAEISHVDDIADAITGGATMVTMSESMSKEKMKKALFYTDSIILYTKGNRDVLSFFIANGGNYAYSDSVLIDRIQAQFTTKLNCDICNVIVPIGGYNGGRDKETPLLP